MARNIECKCEHNLTCGYCLRNAKPYFYTLDSGERIYQPSMRRRKPSTVPEDRPVTLMGAVSVIGAAAQHLREQKDPGTLPATALLMSAWDRADRAASAAYESVSIAADGLPEIGTWINL